MHQPAARHRNHQPQPQGEPAAMQTPLATCVRATATLFLLAIMPLGAAEYNIAANGDWTAAATWSPNVAGGPTAADSIDIASLPAARTVSMDSSDTATFTIGSLIFNSSQNATIQSKPAGSSTAVRRTLKITGDLVKEGTGSLVIRNPYSGNSNYGALLEVEGNVTVNAGTLSLGDYYNNRGLQGTLIHGSVTIGTLGTLLLEQGSGSASFGPTTVNGTLTMGIPGGTGLNKTLVIGGLSGSSSGIIGTLGDYTTARTTTLRFSQGAGNSYTYAGSIIQDPTAVFNTIGIQVNGGGTQTLSGTLSYAGTTTVEGGSTLVLSGTVAPTGTVLVRGNSLLVFQGPNASYGTGHINLYQNGTSGILGLGSGDFSRDLGSGAGQIRLTGGNGTMSGFAAFGADRTVTLNDGVEVTYGSSNSDAGFLPLNLIFGHATADAAVILANDIDITAGSARTMTANRGSAPVDGILAGTLRGSTGLVKTGAGTLAMTKNNSYSGSLTLRDGVLLLADNGNTAGRIVLDGGILGLGNGDMTRPLSTSGGTNINLSRTGSAQGPASGFAAFGADRTVNFGGTGDTVTWGTTAFDAATVLGFSSYNATHTLIFANGINLNGAERTIHVEDGAAAVDARMTGTLSGTGLSSLRKTGAGTLELTTANSYAGGTTVAGGTLLLSNTTGSATGLGPVTVTAGTVAGSGTVGGRLVVGAGATLSPGDSAGILTVGELDLLSGSVFAVELLGPAAGSGYDQVVVTGDFASLEAGAILDLTLGFRAKRGDTFLIVDNQGDSADYGGVFTYGSTELSEGSTFAVGVYVFDITYAHNGNDVLLTVLVPEPASALLLGAAGLLALRRRMR